MAEISREAVWSAFEKDPRADEFPGSMLEVIRPTVEKLPEILSDLVDKPLTVSSFTDAKVRVIEYTLDNGVIEALVKSMPNKELGSLLGMMTAKLKDILLPTLKDIAKDSFQFLARTGLTEKDFLFSPEFGLNEEVKAKYLKGRMTIGKLLVMQPMAIVNNTS
ncbi:MAG TPA: hypothetical protein P5080_02235 [Candidatus Paceibacterota bacterium]|nr:hypothetical protein [Candidatus Pacearchaeota archaeon]HRZ50788.1 hypothetical protein [Candidatus Paceibacterota bacterium]HSA36509.1 hypothetical protein [Candidatus Paceibacterota bacterium]